MEQHIRYIKEKAKEGVDVRVIYDDAGCMFKLPYGYDKRIHGYKVLYIQSV